MLKNVKTKTNFDRQLNINMLQYKKGDGKYERKLFEVSTTDKDVRYKNRRRIQKTTEKLFIIISRKFKVHIANKKFQEDYKTSQRSQIDFSL